MRVRRRYGPGRYLAQNGAAVLVFCLYPRLALAEVCDKEVPGWDVTSGAVSPVGYLLGAATSPLGLIIAGLLGFAFVFRRPWLHALGGTVTLLVFAGLAHMRSDPVFLASVEEGCRGAPYLVLMALAGVLAAFLWLLRQSARARSEQG